MPSFSSYPPQQGHKILYLGHHYAGKTGSIVALAAAGYKVRLLDLDNKAEILRDYLFNPKSIYIKPHPLWPTPGDIASRLSYVTITESFNLQGAKAIPRGDAWHKINLLLNDWRDGDDKPGNISKWPEDDVLVIDGLSRFCESAMNFQLSLSGNLVKGPQVGTRQSNDYSSSYKLVTDCLEMLTCREVKCHVIMICHIDFLEPEGPQQTADRQKRGFPKTIGPKLSTQIGQYFQHALRVKSQGNSPNVRRFIVTNNDENVELITTAPLRVQAQYPIETGLAQYFADIKQEQPQQKEPINAR